MLAITTKLPASRMLVKISNSWKICVFAFLFLISCYKLFAAKLVNPHEDARSYLDADLVIAGRVLSCTTKVIERREIPADSGWIQHYDKFQKIHIIKVDSLVKGSFVDSTIVIQTESSQEWRSRLFKIDEKGDSLFIGEAFVRDEEGDAVIPESGKFIILLKKKEGIYISTLCRVYNKFNLDFFREVEEKGEDYFKPPEPQRK